MWTTVCLSVSLRQSVPEIPPKPGELRTELLGYRVREEAQAALQQQLNAAQKPHWSYALWFQGWTLYSSGWPLWYPMSYVSQILFKSLSIGHHIEKGDNQNSLLVSEWESPLDKTGCSENAICFGWIIIMCFEFMHTLCVLYFVLIYCNSDSYCIALSYLQLWRLYTKVENRKSFSLL